MTMFAFLRSSISAFLARRRDLRDDRDRHRHGYEYPHQDRDPSEGRAAQITGRAPLCDDPLAGSGGATDFRAPGAAVDGAVPKPGARIV
jgi:hypothetical protein